MIQPERIQRINRQLIREGRYVLYWMQAAQRARCNHALEHAIDKANELGKPVVAAFGLAADFPEANARHFHFLLEGLRDTRRELRERGIQMIVWAKSPTACVPDLAREACLVVVDAGHLKLQRQWRAEVGQALRCTLVEVETNLIVPVEEAADKENFSAGTFRPRIRRKLDAYLVGLKPRTVRKDSLGLKFDSLDLGDVDRLVRNLKVDASVGKVDGFVGGADEAQRRLDEFLVNRLDAYPTDRNDPNLDGQSHLSPYLHFGQVSPLDVALQARRKGGRGLDAFLEELIVRRELSHNFVHYNPRYDSFECLPPWAMRTLNFHGRDRREYFYTLEQFEAARTHDPYWNAAQREMVLTGKMHGYMRMYWGKKILAWSETPNEGFRIALYLNNRYELDGRDANGYAGVAWCFGKHDRSWADRPVFGKVRYMNAAGLKRKFDPDAYVERVERLGVRE
ncbi:MAG TPA: deoxyribodipyrimidine photo-lyase [Sedimentisphaerales bacterium]|nr:deoxyribodipyrimidine photo-lyase [Sedimentisphaerales bacterium]HQI26814.1 deoxyribodipyrimidine photo-lyase [Sedimentisphaerales bacterium]